MRVIALNAKGGQAKGTPLAKAAKKWKPTWSPLVLLVSEIDGPTPQPKRIVDALTKAGAKVYQAGQSTHGAREVGVAVFGRGFKVDEAGVRGLQLTPNINPGGAGWKGEGQDRWAVIVPGTYRGQKFVFISTHAPLGTRTRAGAWTHKPQSVLWKKGRAELAAIAAGYRTQGYRVILGADMNEALSVDPSGTEAWSKRKGFVPYVSHVMWALVDAALPGTSVKPIPLAPDISDHSTALEVDVTVKRKPKPPPPPPAKTTAQKVIAAARGEIGYHEGRSGGHWNNIEKYAAQVPGLAWANGQPWCDTFVAWCFNTAGALDLLPGGPSASVAFSRDHWKAAKRFSEYPAVGAQVIYGQKGDAHTGIVVAYDEGTVTTVEGNTNTNGSAEGDGVYLKVHQRTDPWVYGYGYPAYPEGIESADPKWANRR